MKKLLTTSLLFLLTIQLLQAQLVLRPANDGFQMFLGSDTERPTVIGVDDSPIMILSNGYGNIGVNTHFYTGNILNYPTHAKFHIRTQSSGHNDGSGQGPQLLLDENSSGGYSRLRFRNSWIRTTGYTQTGTAISILEGRGRYWDIAAFGNGEALENDRLNIFNSGYGNAMTILGNGWVGINNTNPETRLDVNGFTKSGGESVPYKTKLINSQATGTCSSNSSLSIGLGLNENRIIAVDVLVSHDNNNWYGPGERFNNHEYAYKISGSNIDFEFGAVSGCEFIIRSYRIWVTYASADLDY
ncbi:hypothetical protein [Jiulongibacter sediminis]|jgi:hypothetical protein|uniref:hypothetical protein n=1 Tax=Jiulongibacter sediminis TaxID=1605367 RepID=UPI0026EC7C9E|nr:hypothetical protein [Jiulongibacter sediminis]